MWKGGCGRWQLWSERNAAVVQASDLERRVASAEAQLKEVTRSRDHLFITNHELNTRLTAAMTENRLLHQRVDQLQRTSRHSAAAFRDREATLKQHLAERHAELAASRQQAAAELAQVTSRLEAKVGDGNGVEGVGDVDAPVAAMVRAEEEEAAAVSADAESVAAGAAAGPTVGAEGSALGTPNEAAGSLNKPLGSPNENDLKVYARAIFPAYVAPDASIMEQSRGVTAMVQVRELVVW
ncbi:unnamed protein product [Closterium sp. Yama58-4]|nr:unnamed protein product [Closterium sp. Yama58-4]